MFKDLDKLLGFNFSTLEDSKTSVKKKSDGIVVSVSVVGSFSFQRRVIDYSGLAITAKEDYDLATELVGENIAIMRAQIGIIKQVVESFAFNKEDMQLLLDAEKTLKQELDSYIELKEQFFIRIRNRRENPDYYRVKQVYIDDNGVPHES